MANLLVQPTRDEARNGWTPETLTAYMRDAGLNVEMEARLRKAGSAPRVEVTQKAAPAANPSLFVLEGSFGTGWLRFLYRTAHSVDEVTAPGYFDSVRDYGLREWAEIHAAVGSSDPALATFCRLVITKAPRSGPEHVEVRLIDAHTPLPEKRIKR